MSGLQVFNFKVSADEATRRSNAWNVPNTSRRICSNTDGCEELGKLVCTKCRWHRYCSKGCQKAAWKSHKAECTFYSSEPVHDIVEFNSAQLSSNPRPNITITEEVTDSPVKAFERFFWTQYCECNMRIGYYGDGLFPKTLLVFHTQNDSDDFFNRLQQLHTQTIGEERSNTSTILRMINEATDAATRAVLVEEWKKHVSSIRILVSSPDDDEQLMVPDIENVVVFEKEGQMKSHMRQQEMARMCGQTGVYMTIAPPTKLLVEYFREQKPNERDGVWRPAAWSDAKRQWETERVLRGLDDKYTLNYVCHLLKTGQAYFEEDELRFKK